MLEPKNTMEQETAREAVFLGIDTGLASLAIVSTRCEGGTWVPGGSGVQRLHDIEMIVTEQITSRDRIGRPGAVAVEGYSFGSTFNAHQMGEAGAAVRLALYSLGVKYYDIPPQLVKKFCSGKTQSKKDEMRLAAFRRWAVDLTSEHDVDAFVLSKIAEALYFAEHNLQQEGLTAPQKEVVMKCLLTNRQSSQKASRSRGFRQALSAQSSTSTAATSTAA